jgi:putative FmdB family regulatory protein
MPRYEYKCRECDTAFEVVHGINENVESCSSCGGKVRRVFHPLGIVFKGSGFYATDSKKPDNKPSEPHELDRKDHKPEQTGGNGDKKKDKEKAEKGGGKDKAAS